ncbi:glycosyltransferase involved in cell wall biosynthesis [Chitinophaga polysaccharea]|uniref:Glycosyltransferase involved in cell wall biosynthesis n=2 Tax=Chitinophaga polysaccharea TaxID=1293035 RepID=A0A561Q4H4_9BACT|nr:glycosyltransferase involved in cell wall biosynthesis [Chitinophaga polysaccharea]
MNDSITFPLVSVIIPTYNRAASISDAIESVLYQTYPNVQLIVVDDGSTDLTEELVRKYKEAEYILQTHGGQGKARNNGLAYAQGSYIASLDSDDIWHPCFLEKCIAQLEKQQLDFVFANWLHVKDERRGYDFFLHARFLHPYAHGKNDAWINLDNEQLRSLYTDVCPSPSSSLVLRRSSMKNGWNDQVNIADDWCLLLDIILSKACKASFTFERLWIKQRDGKNICDGRDYFELMELLYGKDLETVLALFSHKLTEEELGTIRYNRAKAFICYAIRQFKRRIVASKSIRMPFKRPPISSSVFLLVIIELTKMRIRKVWSKYVRKKAPYTMDLIPIPDFTINGKLNASSRT